ncbi:MAG TPA: extracellular solute-binding protein [Alphaproteobacteria bacterium]|nr:extracellular solute-binding protein [Alphaproteobacteria bacterium]
MRRRSLLAAPLPLLMLSKLGPWRAVSALAAEMEENAPAPEFPGDYIGQGIAMHGAPKYGPGFTHFDYTDPAAPKGGEVRQAAIGTFDSLNAFILRGVTADAVGYLFDTLMVSSSDEAFSEYGLVAETVEVPSDRAWAIFALRPEARFQDGSPLDADDVIWTFDTLKTKGHPFYRAYYRFVARAEKLGAHRVRFVFSGGDNRELPLILGQLPVLSRKYYATHDFAKTTLTPPLGSGPYRIVKVDPGRSLVLERDVGYWAKDLPVNKGRYNFGRMRIDYYRDENVALEAFKAGDYDFRDENTAKFWATGYDCPALRKGLIKKVEIPNQVPQGMQAYAFNTRRAIFKDPRVRRALGYAFNFEWTNKALFYGQYTRTESYFSNSELASSGLPSAAELAILEPLRGQIPPELFTETYRAPKTDGTGNIRANLVKGFKLLEAAGWRVKDERLVDADGNPFAFEFLLDQPAFERVTLPFVKNLQRLGIDARVRTVDTSQYKNRIDNFDFDVTVAVFPQSLSPGNEQADFWGSAAADQPGSRNVIGIKDAAIDKLVPLIVSAPDREQLVARVHALDRVLLWHFYVIPQWHLGYYRVAYWDKFGRPKLAPKYDLGFDDWWIDPAKAKALAAKEPGA